MFLDILLLILLNKWHKDTLVKSKLNLDKILVLAKKAVYLSFQLS
jgi:hypothetical protein